MAGLPCGRVAEMRLTPLTSAAFADLGNCPTFSDTLVEVEPVKP